MKWISRKRLNKNDAAAQANQAAQTQFYSTLTKNYDADYGKFTGATDNLMAKLKPIVDAGPGQYGYDPTQDAAIRGSVENQDAAAAQNAEQATNQKIIAANGGADLMPTGAADELKQQGDVAAAQKNSTDQTAVTMAGYDQGNTNYEGALTSEGRVLGMLNPNNFAGSATGGGKAATGAVSAATTAAQASQAWMGMVGGALGGVSGALTANVLKPSPAQ